MALSGSLSTNAYNGQRSVTLNWSATQNISANTSTINWTLIGSGPATSYYMSGNFKVVIDGVQAYYSATRIQLRNGTVVASGSHTIGHNADGTRGFAIHIEAGIYTVAVNCTAQQSFTLNQIPREAKLTSAPNFTDEDNPTIQYSNPGGFPIYAYIESLEPFSRPIAERRITGASYTFQFTEAERNVLRSLNTTSNTQPMRFVVRTDMGAGVNPGYTWLDRTLTIKNPKPTLNPTVVDSNSKTVALTGSNSKLVKYYSNAKVTFNAAAVKGASLVSRKVTCGSKSLSADGTINSVESGSFSFSVKDSRGNTTTKTLTKTIVNYVKPTCNIGQSVPDGNGNFVFKVSGAFFNGNFGAATNTLIVEYRYKEEGGAYPATFTKMTVSKSGNSYSASAGLDLDYTKTYRFQARATDSLTSSSTVEKVIKSIPVFDWSETDFNFNVPVKLNGKNLFDLIYPVGSIYISVKSTNPGTLFGGTWVAWGSGRVPVGVNTGDSSFNTVEKTGGEKTHKLTASEMPSHNHVESQGLVSYVDPPKGSHNMDVNLGNGYFGAYAYGVTNYTNNAGGSAAHNNMPPYITCYMWKRTA